jgi:hypothetical protein
LQPLRRRIEREFGSLTPFPCRLLSDEDGNYQLSEDTRRLDGRRDDGDEG